MAIVLNKKGLQSKPNDSINNNDLVLNYNSPSGTTTTKNINLAAGPQLPTADELRATLTESAVTQPKNKLDQASKNINDRIMKLRTERLRSGGNLNLNKELELGYLASAKDIISNVQGVRDIPKTAYAVYKNPNLLTQIPGQIKQAGANFGTLIRESPTEAVAIVGTEVLLMKGSPFVIRKITKYGNQLTRFSPKYKGTLKAGRKIEIIVNGIKRELRIVKRMPSKSLRKQISLQGKTVRPITTQANKLFNFLKSTKTIRKPFRDIKLKKSTIKLIEKFDRGKITRSELIKLNKSLSKTKGILERSLFADPEGNIRPSRLGIDNKEGSFIDYLSGDVTFKKNKPAIYVFNEQKLSKFPKNLKKITSKIRSGKTLNQSETARLLEYQLKKSGKFKPLGHVTRESEITLAPGEIIRKVKKIGVTLYKDKRIPIIQAEVIKPTKRLQKLITKGKVGRLSRSELRQFKRLIKRETGIKLSSSYYSKSKKYFSLKKALFYPTIKSLSSINRSMSSYRKYGYKGSFSMKSGGSGTPGRIPYKPGSPNPRPPYKPHKYKKIPTIHKGPPIIPGKLPPGILFNKSKQRMIKTYQKVQTYNVYGKQGRRFIKLNKAPLRKTDALSRGSYAVDHSTSKTFKIIPAGKRKTIGVINAKESNYFRNKGLKFRAVKISRGRKFKLINKYIEKRKYGIDTRGEKRGLSLARLKKSRKW